MNIMMMTDMKMIMMTKIIVIKEGMIVDSHSSYHKLCFSCYRTASVVFVVVTNHDHHDRYGNDDEDDK